MNTRSVTYELWKTNPGRPDRQVAGPVADPQVLFRQAAAINTEHPSNGRAYVVKVTSTRRTVTK